MHGLAPRAGLVAVVALLLFAVSPLPADASGAGIPSGTRSVDETPSPAATAPTHRPSSRPRTLGPRAAGVSTASIGTVDCERLTVGLTLDNSRSSERVTYGYTVSFQSPLHAPFSGEDRSKEVDVAAGDTTVVALPVRDDARSTVTIDLPDGGHVFAQRTCGAAPGAVFTRTDCDTSRLGLYLDNSSSTLPTRYRWTERDPVGQLATRRVQVAAGDVAHVHVPLVDGADVRVDVTVGDTALVATSAPRGCGRSVLRPRASIGVLECADVSAPILLDNSRSTARLRFHVPAHADVVLGAGETRTLRLHLPIAERLRVYTDDVRADGFPTDLALVSTARCAGATSDRDTTPAPAADAIGAGAGRGDVADPDLAAAGSTPLLPVIGGAALLVVVALVLSGTGRLPGRSR